MDVVAYGHLGARTFAADPMAARERSRSPARGQISRPVFG